MIDASPFGYVNAVGDRAKLHIFVCLNKHHLRRACGEDGLKPSCQLRLRHIRVIDLVGGLTGIGVKYLRTIAASGWLLFWSGSGTNASRPLGITGVTAMKMINNTSRMSIIGVTLMSEERPRLPPVVIAM
jgi:hypothetical protein